jgi:acetyl-CoA acetyltransferase
MNRSIAGEVAIAGVGETGLGRSEGVGAMRLHAEAARLALEDAGLTKNDVDGVLTCNSYTEPYRQHSIVFAEYMGIQPRYTATLLVGGASHAAMVIHGAAAIAAGLCETVLIASADCTLTGMPPGGGVSKMAGWGHPGFDNPYGPLMPSFYALVAQRHMHEFGTTEEQLAQVAVTTRHHATLHPDAMMREPLTLEQCLGARMIASPLRKFDCALVSDGGGALVLTSTERARTLRRPPVAILGMAEGHTHEHLSQAPDLLRSGAAMSGPAALEMAGLRAQDIDVAEIYDCFTISVIALLEDLGFCAKGEGGPFVADGNIGLDGRLPVNTHGGLLSHAHPGPPGGIFHLIEGVRQLRGECGERQVANAETSLVHSMGGAMSTHATVVLGKE